MAEAGLGRWQALELGEVVGLFEDFGAPWWICGGHALELALGRTWRIHDDIDVSVRREDASRLERTFEEWDVEIAADGVLSPWNGSVLRAGGEPEQPVVSERNGPTLVPRHHNR